MPPKSSTRPSSNALSKSKSPRNFNSLPKQKVRIHKTFTIQEFISLSENIPLDQVTDQCIQEWNRKLNNGGKGLKIKRQREEVEGSDIDDASPRSKRAKRVEENENGAEEEGDPNERDAPEENPDEEMPDSGEEAEENPDEDAPEEVAPEEEGEPNSEDEPGEEPHSDDDPEKSDDEESVTDNDHPHDKEPGSDFDEEPEAPEQAADVEDSEPESEPDVEGAPEEDAPEQEGEVEEESEEEGVEEREETETEVDNRSWGFCAGTNKTGPRKRKGKSCRIYCQGEGDEVRWCHHHLPKAKPKKYKKPFSEHDADSCPMKWGGMCEYPGCWKLEYDDE